jgi:hypothetical protein
METTHTPAVSQRPAARGAALDSSAFPSGVWLSTNSTSSSLVSVRLGVAENNLSIGLSWVGDGAPVTWNPVQTDGLYADSAESRKAIALSGTYDLGAVRCRVQANVTLGLLVLSAFNSFAPDTGRVNFFSRAFFHPLDDLDSQSSVKGDATGLAPAAERKTRLPVDPAPLAGTWINTNRTSTGIAKYVVSVRGPQVTARAVTVSGHDLGEVPAHVYAKDGEPPEPMAFLATYDAGDREIEIQARLNLGLLVVAYFYRFKGASSGSNWYTREFYYKA